MIKGIIVSRKSDGLIFCEVMEDDDNDKNFWCVRNKAQEFLKNIKSQENLCTVNIDSQSYIMHYKINENVVYLVITNKSYPEKLAFCFLAEIDEGFTEELKNQFGTQSVSYYSKLETIDRANYFLKFEKFIKKKRNEYLDADTNNSNIERLNREISDVHQIMAENINLIMDRDRTMNSINSLSESIKDNSSKFEKTARNTKLKMLWAKYSILISIAAIVLLIIIFKIFL
jgi:vesicle transport protein SEC22